MAIMKILDFLYSKTKLPAMITLTIVLLNGLVISNSILAKDRSPDILESQFGSYLAGRQAQFNSDPNSAIQYYLSSLKQSPNNIFLLRQIIPLLVSHGKVDEALPKAKQLLSFQTTHQIPQALPLSLLMLKITNI